MTITKEYIHEEMDKCFKELGQYLENDYFDGRYEEYDVELDNLPGEYHQIFGEIARLRSLLWKIIDEEEKEKKNNDNQNEID